jgi:type VI protein secretion system component Hcp
MKATIRKSMTRGLVLLLVVIAIAMVPTAASAATQIFMLVPGIPGGSQVSGRSGWIDIFAFSGGVNAPATSTSPAPVRQPTPTPCQISVEKQLDIAGPLLWVATATGQIFHNIDIQVTTVAPGGVQFVAYDILLTNVQVMSIADSGSTGGGLPVETLSFKAANASLTVTPQNSDGTAGTPVTTSFSCN